MELIEYIPECRQRFTDLNSRWILENFGHLEAEDLRSFASIEEQIRKGARIVLAKEQEEIAAVCMVRPCLETGTWELCKLACDPCFQNNVAGSLVFESCMDYAAAQGARRLLIISNSRLKPALHLYRKHGFHEIPLVNTEYERADIAFEYLIPRS